MSWVWQSVGAGMNGGGGGSSAPAWRSIYEVDFSAEPNQTIGAAGSYTIGKATWWAKGALVYNHGGANTYTLSIVNGTGLRWATTGASGFFFSTGVAFPGRVMFMPFAQFTSYNPALPLCLQFVLGPAVTTQILITGVADMASSSAAVTSAERFSMYGVSHVSGSVANEVNFGTTLNMALSTVSVLAAPTAILSTEYGVMSSSSLADGAVGQVAVATFNSPATGRMGVGASCGRNLAKANPGVFIGYQNSSGAGTTDEMRRLRVAQPG